MRNESLFVFWWFVTRLNRNVVVDHIGLCNITYTTVGSLLWVGYISFSSPISWRSDLSRGNGTGQGGARPLWGIVWCNQGSSFSSTSTTAGASLSWQPTRGYLGLLAQVEVPHRLDGGGEEDRKLEAKIGDLEGLLVGLGCCFDLNLSRLRWFHLVLDRGEQQEEERSPSCGGFPPRTLLYSPLPVKLSPPFHPHQSF